MAYTHRAHSHGRQSTNRGRNNGGHGNSGGRNHRGHFRGRHGGGGGRKRARATFDPTQFINKNPVAVVEEVYTPKHRFADFAIDERMVATIAALGITAPTPIQDQIIPIILNGKDVIGLAETGTGKTAAFLIPLIEHKKADSNVTTLILTPTRELALQVDAELHKLAKGFHFSSTVCVGGTAIGPQIQRLRRHNQFVIGTPGRVKDLIARGILRTSVITSVVLDEADRMLDMGFINDMRSILGTLPQPRHTLFFSATMDDKTRALVNDFMHDPIMVSVKKKDVTDSIAQDVIMYAPAHKFETLVEFLKQDACDRVIIFGAMKHSVEKLGKELNHAGISAQSIHGNKNHNQRQHALRAFKEGRARVLVATDVAARGIHVDNVTHVINYDLPNTFEDYVHRIGRTGRGSNHGQAFTFIPQQ